MPTRFAYAFVVAVVSGYAFAATAAATPVASSTTDESPAEVRGYWTEERMDEAIPLDLAPASGTATAPAVAHLRQYAAPRGKPRFVPATKPDNLAATTITNTTQPGIRTHGKVFASTPAFDFVCSGTVVTAPNRSTVWTAAHCIYDTDTDEFATNFMFVPGYNDGARPFGTWSARVVSVPSAWVNEEENIDDVGAAAMRVKMLSKTAAQKRKCNRFEGNKKRRCKRKKVPVPIQGMVGSRGIAFNLDPEDYTYSAIGYPVNPQPRFDGQHMERCISPLTMVDNTMGPPPPIGIECDMQGGSSGGGWVIPGQYVNGNVSYGYPSIDPNTFYSPYYDGFLRNFYNAIRDQ